jgi:hypothetical protein
VLDKAAAGLSFSLSASGGSTPTFAARRMQRLTSLTDRSRCKFSAGRHGHSGSQQNRRKGQARAFSRECRMLAVLVALVIDAAIIAAYLAVLHA